MMHDLHGEVHLEEGKDFNGADITSLYNIESAIACRTACEEHRLCLAFTYVKTDRVCWLKGEGFTTKANPNTVSGGINATLAASRKGLATEDKVGDEGEGWRDGSDSYERDAGALGEPMGDEGDTDIPGYDPDDSDGLSSVQLSEEEQQLYNDSTSFFGDVRLLHDVREPAICEHRCRKHGRCVGWTLDKFRFICMLRLQNVSALMFARDFVSGRLTSEEIVSRAARLSRLDTERMATTTASPGRVGDADGEEPVNEGDASSQARGTSATGAHRSESAHGDNGGSSDDSDRAPNRMHSHPPTAAM